MDALIGKGLGIERITFKILYKFQIHTYMRVHSLWYIIIAYTHVVLKILTYVKKTL